MMPDIIDRYVMNRTKFLDLCASRPWPEVQSALKNGSDPNTTDRDGVSALMLAAAKNPHGRTSRVLIEYGSDVNARCGMKHPETPGYTPLLMAAREAVNPEGLTALLEAGADSEVRGDDSRTALIVAAEMNRNTGILMALLRGGANVNSVWKDGITPLMLAAKNNTIDVVETLLEHGAYINAKDDEGRTALMYAAACNKDFKVLKALLDRGASSNAKDKSGRTVLMYASEYNRNPLVIRDLLKARAFVNAKTEDGKTPLAFAVLRHKPDPYIVLELLHFGANPDVYVNGRRLECFAKDSPYLRGTQALRALRVES